MIERIFKYKVARFLFVGTSAVVIDVSVNYFIVLILHLYAPIESGIANVVSISVAFVYNFTLSRKWTFQSNSPNKKKQFIKFLGLNITNLITSTLLIALLVLIFKEIIPFRESTIQILFKIIITAIYAVFNYIIYQKWIFKD